MTDMPVSKPAKTRGLAHLFAASGYSFAGLQRLWGEAAFRHEALVAGGMIATVIGLKGLSMHVAVLVVLSLLTFAVEALNTALEEVVDHLSPDWSLFAKHAKDLGSFAVMCLLLATGIYALSVVLLT